MFFRLLPIIFTALLFCPLPGFSASNNWQPGFRTFGIWQQKNSIRLDFNVWYPTRRAPGKHSFPPWTVTGSLNAKPGEGKFPLLLLSHPSPANRFFFSKLAAWFACRGFIVAIPTHTKDNLDNLDNLHTWEQLKDRVNEINAILQEISDNPIFANILDKEKVGFIGFGAGAAAGLLLGGCLPDCANWQYYQQGLNKLNIYKQPRIAEKIIHVCSNFPLTKSLANPAIKSLALIAPDYAFLFNKESFQYFYPAILLISAGNNPAQENGKQADYLGKLLGNRAYFLDLPEIAPFILQDECPPALLNELPEICDVGNTNARKKIRLKLENNLYTFFNQTLIQNTVKIPDPPNIAIPSEPVKQAPEPARPKKRKRKTS